MIPQDYFFSALHSGIKKGKQNDLGIIVSGRLAVAAAVFTTSRVKAAPIILSEKHISNARHRAIICNSGCANSTTGRLGDVNAQKTVTHLAKALGCRIDETLVASTGVITEHLPMAKIESAIPKLVKNLGKDSIGFCRAIMTTDTKPKSAFKRITVGRKKVVVWGCTKGAGMIHPNMATMLGFVVTDAKISKKLLQSSLAYAVERTFNRITVDGDTSTNDSVFVMANGAAGNEPLKKGSPGYKKFALALLEVCGSLAKQIVMDGEGADRIAKITVAKAASEKEALTVARAIAGSLLVKTALHGCDPNWGRIIAAAGYSGAPVDPAKMSLHFGPHCALRNGKPVENMEKKLAAQMRKKEVVIKLTLNRGKAEASYLFCDLGKEYITINADYRS